MLYAVNILSNLVFHEQTKHNEVNCHFIREKVQDGLVSTGYVKTREQLGNILTKALNRVKISYMCNKLDTWSTNLLQLEEKCYDIIFIIRELSKIANLTKYLQHIAKFLDSINNRHWYSFISDIDKQW